MKQVKVRGINTKVGGIEVYYCEWPHPRPGLFREY